MKLPGRREKDETRVLPEMGKALGWSDYNTTGGRAIANPEVNDNALEVPGKGHVSVRGNLTPDKFQGTEGTVGTKNENSGETKVQLRRKPGRPVRAVKDAPTYGNWIKVAGGYAPAEPVEKTKPERGKPIAKRAVKPLKKDK